jgi:hypothetical protein
MHALGMRQLAKPHEATPVGTVPAVADKDVNAGHLYSAKREEPAQQPMAQLNFAWLGVSSVPPNV